MTQYKIGEIARLLGLTTQALRFYEKEGVITPEKSDSGTRYYTVGQIVQLLSFKKYRQADFSVQEVVEHFREDDLQALGERLSAQSAALAAQADMLARKAQAVQDYARLVRDTQAAADRIELCTRPPLYLLCVPLDELTEIHAAGRRALTAFIEAMPATGIAFTRRQEGGAHVSLRLCASEEVARRWSLPLDMSQLLPPVRCARICRSFEKYAWGDASAAWILDRIRAAGYSPDPAQELLGLHIASETHNGIVSLSTRVYVPIL